MKNVLSYLFKAPAQETFLKTDDLGKFKTFIIYWDHFNSVKPEVSEIVNGTKQGQKLLEAHIRANGDRQCIYSSVDSAINRLFDESRCSEKGAYILCSQNDYQPGVSDLKSLVVERAVEFSGYFMHKHGTVKDISRVSILTHP